MSSPRPIRIALLGTGIFARDVHAPDLLTLRDRFEIVALYNHHRDSARPLARQLAEALGTELRITTDLPALLARDDLDAVDVVLPIHVMPDVVRRALAAGKHVISEKPIAPDVVTARTLLADAAPYLAQGQVWMVAENYRYESAFLEARKVISDLLSHRPMVFHWAQMVDYPGSPYFDTRWRRAPNYPGGSLLDGGVHSIAVLRDLLGEVTEVRALTTTLRPDVPPFDTLCASLTFESGTVGTLTLCYAHGVPWPQELVVTSETGALRVRPGHLATTVAGATHELDLPYHDGVLRELTAFADAIQHGTPHRNSPHTAAQDVAVIEALLRAAASGQATAPERIVP